MLDTKFKYSFILGEVEHHSGSKPAWYKNYTTEDPRTHVLHSFALYNFLADPGEARGGSINSLVINSLIKSVILFLPQLYSAVTPKMLELSLPVIK